MGFEKTHHEFIHGLEFASRHHEIGFVALKLTGISDTGLLEKIQNQESLSTSEQKNYEALKNRLQEICKTAVACKTPVFIDAEESWIQDTIDGLAEEMMKKYNQEEVYVFTTVQLYRKDRFNYLVKLVEKAKKENYNPGIKLVRGAYLEKETKRSIEKNYPNPLQDSKKATDEDFNRALKFCLDHLQHLSICAGTHNEESNYMLIDLMEEKHIQPSDKRIWFAQLYGMSDHITYNLAYAGYNVAKYLPYGPVKAVMPYLIRRAEENSSIQGQSSRELELVKKEISRRKI